MGGAIEHVHGMGEERLLRQCEVHFCALEVRSSGATLCEGHYGQRRRGKPFTELKPRRIEGTQCAIGGCEKERKGKYCAMHEARIRRHGDPDVMIHQRDRNIPRGEAHPMWTEDATYNAVHLRLRKQRGRPSKYSCFKCGAPARQWAYVHNRDKALQSEYGVYSTDHSDYEPMCVPCHKRMDNAFRRDAELVK